MNAVEEFADYRMLDRIEEIKEEMTQCRPYPYLGGDCYHHDDILELFERKGLLRDRLISQIIDCARDCARDSGSRCLYTDEERGLLFRKLIDDAISVQAKADVEAQEVESE